MRDIHFRGKRKSDGKWIYGLYSDHRAVDADFVCIAPFRGIGEYGLDWGVLPDTVGQFTGFKDKDGRYIYEGDILESHYDADFPDDACYEQVMWEDNGWHIMQLPDCLPEPLDRECLVYSKVIGNIYDNPELLERKK